MRNGKEFVTLSWNTFYLVFRKLFKKIISLLYKTKKGFLVSSVVLGPLVSLESVYAFKKFISKLGMYKSNVFHYPLCSIIATDPTLIEEIDFVHFHNVNVRYSSPVLNIHLRNLYLKSNVLFTLTGSYNVMNYFIKHIGNSPLKFVQMLRGRL